MRVLIDADGCPVVRETVRQAPPSMVPCLLFCDTAHVFSIPGVEVFVADCAHDSTDYLLLSHLRPGDVVITQDYGLAALCLARSAQALHPAGHAYTKDNIDALLTVRAESARLRRGGVRLHRTGCPEARAGPRLFRPALPHSVGKYRDLTNRRKCGIITRRL